MVRSLVRSIPSLFPLLTVAGLILATLAIVGINLFAGKFYYCDIGTSSSLNITQIITKQVYNNRSIVFINFTLRIALKLE